MEANALRIQLRSRFSLLIFATFLPISPTLAGGQSWTVDAIMNIPVLGDPQISPNGKFLAYTRRTIEHNVWVNTVYAASIPFGEAQVIAKGSHAALVARFRKARLSRFSGSPI